MSVEVTRLPSGLDGRDRRDAASGNAPRSASGSAPAAATSSRDEHGISHLLEHMAFKGTSRRTARQIAEEIEAVGGDLNAATSRRDHGLLCARAQGRRAARARRAVRHPVRSGLRSGGAAARAERHRAGDRRGRGHARRSRLRPAAGAPPFPISRSAARSSARPRPCARSTARELRAYLARNYRAPDMVVAAAGAVDHQAVVAEVEQRFASFTGPAAPAPEPARFGGGSHIETRDLEQVHIALALQGLPQRDPNALQPAGLHQRARRRHVVAAVPGGAREARALLLDLCLPCALFGHRHVRPLCRHRRRRRAGADAGRGRRDHRLRPRPSPRPRSRAPRRR